MCVLPREIEKKNFLVLRRQAWAQKVQFVGILRGGHRGTRDLFKHVKTCTNTAKAANDVITNGSLGNRVA